MKQCPIPPKSAQKIRTNPCFDTAFRVSHPRADVPPIDQAADRFLKGSQPTIRHQCARIRRWRGATKMTIDLTRRGFNRLVGTGVAAATAGHASSLLASDSADVTWTSDDP